MPLEIISREAKIDHGKVMYEESNAMYCITPVFCFLGSLPLQYPWLWLDRGWLHGRGPEVSDASAGALSFRQPACHLWASIWCCQRGESADKKMKARLIDLFLKFQMPMCSKSFGIRKLRNIPPLSSFPISSFLKSSRSYNLMKSMAYRFSSQ